MDIKEAIRILAGVESVDRLGIICTVLSVNSVAATCECDPVDDSAIVKDVRLQAAPGNGMLCIPVVGSVVIVQLVSDAEGFVAMFSELESVQYLDGSFGGLTKTPELKIQLDKTNEVVNAIANALTTWTVAPNDGGAALKAAAIAALAGKIVGDFSDIENEDITHGTP